MTAADVDPRRVLAWLTGRSLARGVALPVADHGGYRVDTRSEVEVSRWIYPVVNDGLSELARAIGAPGHLLKWLGKAEDGRAMLPNGWHIHPPAYFMQAGDDLAKADTPKGYRTEMSRTDQVIMVRILDEGGTLAASGYAADTPDAFVYDRIVTTPEHRRKKHFYRGLFKSASGGIVVDGNWNIAAYFTYGGGPTTSLGTGNTVGVTAGFSDSARSVSGFAGPFSNVTGQLDNVSVGHFSGYGASP